MSYTCYQHGWSDEHLPCPQCQPHIVSTATTNTEHQSNHTPEQRGVDANYRANFLWGFPDDSIEMIGYEFANGKTEEYLKECWTALLDKIKTHQSPLPSKVQEGEAERKDETIYTYYQIDIENINEEWDYTICESLEEVLGMLKYLDVHLDDDTPTEDGQKRKVIITGIGMTPVEYRCWKKENGMD